MNNKKLIQEYLEKTTNQYDISFSCDWDSLMFWKPMNWRNFTFIYFNIEVLSLFKYLELDLALLGFHFGVNWYRDEPRR